MTTNPHTKFEHNRPSRFRDTDVTTHICFPWLDPPPPSLFRSHASCRMAGSTCVRTHAASTQPDTSGDQQRPRTTTHASCRMAGSTCVRTHAASTRPDTSGDQPRPRTTTHASCRMAGSTCVRTHAASTRPDTSGDQPRPRTTTHASCRMAGSTCVRTHAASTRPDKSGDQPHHTAGPQSNDPLHASPLPPSDRNLPSPSTYGSSARPITRHAPAWRTGQLTSHVTQKTTLPPRAQTRQATSRI